MDQKALVGTRRTGDKQPLDVQVGIPKFQLLGQGRNTDEDDHQGMTSSTSVIASA